jgi:transposase
MSEADAGEEVECPECSKVLASRRGLKIHQGQVHSGEAEYRDKEWLRGQYIDQERTQVEIAKICGVTDETISYWMQRHSIPTQSKQSQKEIYHGEEWLRQKYHGEGKDAPEIAEECGTTPSVIFKWLVKNGIETRGREVSGTYTPYADTLGDGGWLREQYQEAERTSLEIADEVGSSGRAVRRWLEKHGIGTRSRAEAVPSGPESPLSIEEPAGNYGAGWSEGKKQRVREAAGNECEGCGMSQEEHRNQYDVALHVHHITPARQIDNPKERNAVDNLTPLCYSCHRTAEQMVPLYPFVD